MTSHSKHVLSLSLKNELQKHSVVHQRTFLSIIILSRTKVDKFSFRLTCDSHFTVPHARATFWNFKFVSSVLRFPVTRSYCWCNLNDTSVYMEINWWENQLRVGLRNWTVLISICTHAEWVAILQIYTIQYQELILERATSIQRLWNGVFTSRFIFRLALPAN